MRILGNWACTVYLKKILGVPPNLQAIVPLSLERE
jgi:hypothetical protein